MLDDIFIDNYDIIYQKNGQIKTCDDYLYGYCHLFALCLKEIFGSRAEIVSAWQWEERNEEYESGHLAHSYVCIDNDYFIDARGVINKAIIKEEYFIDEENVDEVEDSHCFLHSYIKDGLFEDFLPEEKEQIMDFISKNILVYDLDN